MVVELVLVDGDDELEELELVVLLTLEEDDDDEVALDEVEDLIEVVNPDGTELDRDELVLEDEVWLEEVKPEVDELEGSRVEELLDVGKPLGKDVLLSEPIGLDWV